MLTVAVFTIALLLSAVHWPYIVISDDYILGGINVPVKLSVTEKQLR
jgi:hypothetical protein